MSKLEEKSKADYFDEWFDALGIVRPDGSVDLEQVLKEMQDYYFLLNEVPKVYCEITGGRLSYPHYHAHSVISAYENHLRDLEEQMRLDLIEDLGRLQ